MEFNIEALKRYTSSQAIKDFDKFLDSIPTNVGVNVIIAAAVMWAVAAGALYFAVNQAELASKMNAELVTVKSLKPPVPKLVYKSVDRDKLKEFSDTVSQIYKGLSISNRGQGKVVISAQDTDFFPQFISSISYFQRGARNWKVNISEMCVGQDCRGAKLSATLKIEVARIEEQDKNK